MKLTAVLRRQGIGVISATSAKSLKAQMRQANNLKIARAVIIGDDEVKAWHGDFTRYDFFRAAGNG